MSPELDIEELGLGADHHPPGPGKLSDSLASSSQHASAHLEVRARLAEVDLPDQFPAWIPDLNTVAAACVNVAIGVAVNA